ncbi:MAG: hypothetical protein LBN41_02880 [Enterobacteriaceae bacterium]|jgi:hypothetical protein|nr:hypothetical protein [Enterobacteriaceae bacterium]
MNTENTLKVIELTNEEKLTISQGITDLLYSPDGDNEYISIMRKQMWHILPNTVTNALEHFKKPFSEYSGIKITNLPIDDVIIGSPLNNETGQLVNNLVNLSYAPQFIPDRERRAFVYLVME